MIDWTRVNDLQAEIGEEDFAEVIHMFLEEATEIVNRLSGDFPAEELEAALHFLKGSALNLGFRKLAELCQEGERAAAIGQGASVNLARVVILFHESVKAYTEAAATRAA